MFLNTVIIILQEALEAALLLGVLLVVAGLQAAEADRRQWRIYLLSAVLLGLACSAGYAYALPAVSEWFDYTGQEIVNSAMHLLSVLCLLTLAYLPASARTLWRISPAARVATSCMLLITFFALVREGSEIIIYLEGATQSTESVLASLSGTVIGAGIGFSAAVFLYYSLVSMQRTWTLRMSVLLLALVTGSMASQVVMLLTQADILPYSDIAWDSSGFIAESSVTGHLLYALIGYEATPSLLQAGCYLLGILAWLPGPLFRSAWVGGSHSNGIASSV